MTNYSYQNEILVRSGLLPVKLTQPKLLKQPSFRAVTFMSNCMHYGFIPSAAAVAILEGMNDSDLKSFWGELEPVLDKLTGSSTEATEHIVYKNFPDEVIEKSDFEYWLPQILMYWGLDKSNFTEEEKPRKAHTDNVKYKVLHAPEENSLSLVYSQLLEQKSKWSDLDECDAMWLYENLCLDVDLSDIPFKENALTLAHKSYEAGNTPKLTATLDILRFAAKLSDVSMRLSSKTRFRNFKRSERRMFLEMIEGAHDLILVASDNQVLIKKFISRLNPNESAKSDGIPKYPLTSAVMDDLYNKRLRSSGSFYEESLLQMDSAVLNTMQERPTLFSRKLIELYNHFGAIAFTAFSEVADEVDTMRLLETIKHIETYNTRKYKLALPRASWDHPRFKIVEGRLGIDSTDIENLVLALSYVLESRLRVKYPSGVAFGGDLDKVFLPTNDLQLASYGRGTVFDIPEAVKVVRTNTFWDTKDLERSENVWFDNGWSLFNNSFEPMGCVDWYTPTRSQLGCYFSGDPTSSDYGTQVIDLSLDELKGNGVKYALWTCLCYSHIPFSDASRVYAGLQFAESPSKGKILQPNRCQMTFDIKSKSLSSVMCILDIETRELIHLDTPIALSVGSASMNMKYLSEIMPSVLEYISSKPTLADLMRFAPTAYNRDEVSLIVTYSDAGEPLVCSEGYVFKPENPESDYKPITLSEMLS
ncbi:conserved hypothetical protein [Vibrio chagasii]|nr:conserved hypothetical protein [Vibrio chagasii]